MNKFVKAIWIILAVVTILTLGLMGLVVNSIFEINTAMQTGFINSLLKGSAAVATIQQVLLVMVIVALVGNLIMLIVAIATKSKENAMVLEYDDGEIVITDTAVKSNVLRSLCSFDSISAPSVDTRIYGKKNPRIKVDVDCYTNRTEGVDQLGAEIQDTVKSSLEHMTHIPVEDVRVKFHKEKRKKNKSRVV